METTSIFEAISKQLDFLAMVVLILPLVIDGISGKEREENWDQLGTVRKLTREQIRAEPGYENLSDEEVDNIIETNYQLSLICYNNYKANITAFYVGKY